jgi:hypothetical protein
MHIDDPTLTQRVQAVTSHTAEYMQRWWGGAAVPRSVAQNYGRLLAAGRGPARVPTCSHTLRHAPTREETPLTDEDESWYDDAVFEDYPQFRDGVVVDYGPTSREFRESGRRSMQVSFFYPVIVWALSLLEAGELRALRVKDPNVFRIIDSMLPPLGGPLKTRVSEALNSLSAIEFTGDNSLSEIQSRSAAALIERCSGTVTEVRGLHLWHAHQTAIAPCMRLESLTCASSYSGEHDLWLGLSQLHTLRDVDVKKVSFATLAAALPRLQTLHARSDWRCERGQSAEPLSVDGFFEDLLPRLRVFHFSGLWPEQEEAECDGTAPPPPRLPLLQELVWNPSCRRLAPRAFLGAQPTVLHASYNLVARFCGDGRSPTAQPATWAPLACVRELRVLRTWRSSDTRAPSDAKRVLRAAPELRIFDFEHPLHGGPSCLTAWTGPLGTALSHGKLWRLGLSFADATAPPADCAVRLRESHFPRLRELRVGDRAYFAPPDEGEPEGCLIEGTLSL